MFGWLKRIPERRKLTLVEFVVHLVPMHKVDQFRKLHPGAINIFEVVMMLHGDEQAKALLAALEVNCPNFMILCS